VAAVSNRRPFAGQFNCAIAIAMAMALKPGV
jgi:hypothetical protein